MKGSENYGDEPSRLGPSEPAVQRKRPSWYKWGVWEIKSGGVNALIVELDGLAPKMREVAERMQEYEGEIREHGEELERASKIVRTWAQGIKEQLGATRR